VRKYKLLIIGAPRSGTVYVQQCLNWLGMDLGHENIAADGGVGYNLAEQGERKKRGVELYDVGMVCHLLRHPCHVIPSIDANLGHDFVHFDSTYGGTAGWWYYWNQMCNVVLANAKQAGCQTMTFRVEDAVEDAEDVLPFIARECGARKAEHKFPKHISRTTNHGKEYEPWEWCDLPGPVKEYAQRWYKIQARGLMGQGVRA
jgi:hypothetical protein